MNRKSGKQRKLVQTIFRAFLMSLAGIFFVWFALPLTLSVRFNIGNVTGLAVAALLFLYGLFMPWVNKMLNYRRNYRILCYVYRGMLCLLLVIGLLVITETSCMILAANKKAEPDATVVVLGCRVYGESPSLSLVERLDAAYNHLIQYPEAKCILSGGRGDGENITEAECMYRYLIKKGIASERLYKEENSTTTRENLLFSKELMNKQGLNTKIAIATSEYHIYRAGRIADALDISWTAVPGKTAIWLFPTYYVRELYGILYEWVF